MSPVPTATGHGAAPPSIAKSVTVPACMLLAIAALALRWMPVTAWWDFVFDRWQLDLWWPLVVAALASCWLGLGMHQHRMKGLPLYAPLAALILTAAQLALAAAMVVITAPHWSLQTTEAALVVLGLTAGLLAVAVFGYAETWRHYAGPSIEAQLELALDRGRLVILLDQAWARKRWGSAHGIAVLARIQRGRLHRAGLALERDALDDAALQQAVDATAALRVWLDFNWAPQVFDGRHFANERLNCTLQLVLLLAVSPALRLPPGTNAERTLELPSAGDHPHLAFLLLCVQAMRQPPAGGSQIIELLRRADAAYATARTSVFPPGASAPDCLVLREAFWLAAAGRGALAEPVFDLWLHWRQQRDTAAHLPPLNIGKRAARAEDFVLAAARLFLRRCYAGWADHTAPGWADGLVARAHWNGQPAPSGGN